MLKLSRQCINAFKRGKVWESEGIGALYEINNEEQKIVDDFESIHNCLVYHMIHNVFEFGECYTLLYVSPDEYEWSHDRAEIKDFYVMSYVKNIDNEMCSEFGVVAVKPSIGGLIRIG